MKPFSIISLIFVSLFFYASSSYADFSATRGACRNWTQPQCYTRAYGPGVYGLDCPAPYCSSYYWNCPSYTYNPQNGICYERRGSLNKKALDYSEEYARLNCAGMTITECKERFNEPNKVSTGVDVQEASLKTQPEMSHAHP